MSAHNPAPVAQEQQLHIIPHAATSTSALVLDGDSLDKMMRLADVMAQTGASEAQLREVNDIPPRMMIKAGSALIVPRLEPHTQDVPQQLANNARLEFTPEYSLVTKRKAIRVQRGLALLHIEAAARNVSASALGGINILMTLFPGAMFALGAIFVAAYTLDEKTYRDIVHKISLRKQNAL